MTRRAPPGPQVASGRLRVDATRAITKLRAYQLDDPTAWVLEAIRAAVASGATALRLTGDADDVVLTWAGPPWPRAELPRLFDALVSPEGGAGGPHLRLLASAVNSGLGTDPAFIDVIALDAGTAHHVRYTPAALDEVDVAAGATPAPLAQLERATTAPPGMRLHLRRRAGLDVIGRALLGRRPPELAVAARACRDLPVPITIDDVPHGRRLLGRDVVRVPLGDGLEGFLALCEPAAPGPAEDVYLAASEHGVVIEHVAISVPGGGEGRPLPLRLVLDAPRLPSNASRSKVRLDVHPVTSAITQARALVPALLEALHAQVAAAPEDPRLRATALGVLAARIGGTGWAAAARALTGPLAALARLPLLREPTGERRPLIGPEAAWTGLVLDDARPHPAALAPWLRGTLWAPPGDPARHLIGSYRTEDAAQLVARARREHRAEQRFLAHAEHPGHVRGVARPLVRMALGAAVPGSCVPDAWFEACAGEVCVGDRPPGELTLLHRRRAIASRRFDTPIGFAAVVESPRLTPRDRHRDVEADAGYAHVERAVRGGVLRAVEALTRADAGHPHPEVEAAALAEVPAGERRRLVRAGIALARSLGLAPGPALTAALRWTTITGAEVDVEALRATAVIGIAEPGTLGDPPADRLVIHATDDDLVLLRQLLGEPRLLRYGADRLSHRDEPFELARALAHTHEHALAILDPDLPGAIAVALDGRPRLRLRHQGVLLQERPYRASTVPATIVVDADALVPTRDWRDLVDDAGLGKRDWGGRERALLQAIALALVGARPTELVGDAPVELASAAGRALCVALAATPADELLGAGLAARLRAQPLVRLLGAPRRLSADALRALPPGPLYFAVGLTAAVPGLTILDVDAAAAAALGALAGREVLDATPALTARRTAALHAERLAAHAARPASALELPGATVRLSRADVRGLVGVGGGTTGLELEIRIDGRPFHVEHRPHDLPLRAIVDGGPALADDAFVAIQPALLEALVTAVLGETSALIAHIARTAPTALADPGPARQLLAAWVGQRTPSRKRRTMLRGAIAFATIQGERARLADLGRDDARGVEVARWRGPWLPPGPDSAHHRLDRPVLQLEPGDPELAGILRALDDEIHDVTDEAEHLQAHRQMVRGLRPAPRVAQPAELTRALGALGAAGAALGPGEIALVAGRSRALLHVRGELREQVALDVLPPVEIALEAPDLIGQRGPRAPTPDDDSVHAQLAALRDDRPVERALAAKVAAAAAELARELVIALRGEALPHAVRPGLRAALFAGDLTEADLADAPVFAAVAAGVPRWVGMSALREQLAWFGDLWCTPAVVPERPLDERRLVLVLGEGEVARAPRGLPLVHAHEHLRRDEACRRNRARPPATTLGPPSLDALVTLALDGDGASAPRGTVSVLPPAAAARRGLWPHRAMHPFDPLPDPCAWPTVAIIDDARLTPDDAWQHPRQAGAAWDEVVAAVRGASERALASLAPAPPAAVVDLPIDATLCAALTTLAARRTQLRGRLWLLGAPLAGHGAALTVTTATGARTFALAVDLALGGTVFVQGDIDDAVLAELSAIGHTGLARRLAAVPGAAPDVVAAHGALALHRGQLRARDLPTLRVTCIEPTADGAALAALLRGGGPVGISDDDPAPRLRDDGSATARVLHHLLGARLRRAPAPRPTPRAPATRPSLPSHPLAPLVARLTARLHALGVARPALALDDEAAAPLVRVRRDRTMLAAQHPHLRAAVTRGATTDATIDLLCAHIVSVLNAERADITDAAEAQVLGHLLRDA